MIFNLYVEPQVSPMSMKEFIKKAPNYSIAIDGYVAEKTQYHIPKKNDDKTKTIVNFNHHEGVDRMITFASCQQVLMAFRQGMYKNFINSYGETEINLFTDGCDEDVCLCVYLLQNLPLILSPDNPVINRLVNFEGMLDANSGLYPINKDNPMLKVLAWIFDPFYKAKFNGLLDSNDPKIFKDVIKSVCLRIHAHIMGNGETAPLDTRYKVLGGNSDWKLVEEIGTHSKTGMMSDGITAFVSVKSMGENKWRYVIGKTAPFIMTFDLQEIFNELNKIEGLTDDKWGGADIIGGSPRVNGSSIPPSEMEKIINSLVIK